MTPLIRNGCRQCFISSRRLLHVDLSSSVDSSTLEKLKVESSAATNAFITPADPSDRNSAYITAAVKDNISTLRTPTTCASNILGRAYRSPFDANVVARLSRKSSGWRYRVEGKTNLDEFGMGSHSMNSAYGSVRRLDRRNNGHSPGGSSGGSAVAVKEMFSHIGLGTDTGGSVRLPAAYMGIVGFKPSYGLVSRWGVVPYANSLDTVGFLGQTVAPVRDAFWNAAGHDSRDPTSVSNRTRQSMQSEPLRPKVRLEGLKIGYPLEYNIKELDSRVKRAWIDALRTLRRLGASIVPVSLPNTKHALSAYYVLAPAEASSNLSKYDGIRYGRRSVEADATESARLYARTRDEGFGGEVKRRIVLGSFTLSSRAIDNYFIKAQKVRRLIQRDFDRVFNKPNPLRPQQQFDIGDLHESIPLQDKLGPAQVDFIICPTAPTPAPRNEDVKKHTPVHSYTTDVFTVPASLAGIPAISIPWSASDRYHPAGIQILGQYGDDHGVLSVAETLFP